MADKFIPKNAKELVGKMTNYGFVGKYYIEESDIVCWEIVDLAKIKIILNNQPDEAYVMYTNIQNIGGHDHILMSELWNFLEKFNEGKFVIKSKKGFFGKEKKKVYFEENK